MPMKGDKMRSNNPFWKGYSDDDKKRVFTG